MRYEVTLLILGLVLLAGHFFGLGARRFHLPTLIGFMALGVLLGPSLQRWTGVELLGERRLHVLGFVTEISLGLVAFNIGAELSLASLRRLGFGIVSIIIAESFGAFFVTAAFVYGLTALLHKPDLPLALVFGSMAPASAPAGTVAVIHEYKAKGPLTKALYAVVGFDDGLAIVIFGLALAVAKTLLASGGGSAADILASLRTPCVEIGESLIVGGALGLAFSFIVRFARSEGDMLIMVFGVVFVATGLSLDLHLSLILTNLMVGFVFVNVRRHEIVLRVTKPVLAIMPMVFVLFFCLAGAHLDLAKLPALGLFGIVYILGRSAGLIGGARVGAMLGHVEEVVKRNVGLGILSQAGVAIGLSLIACKELGAMGTPHAVEIGVKVLATITATCIFFEVVGPILAKIALTRAGEIQPGPK